MSDLISRSALLKSIREISTNLLNEWDTMGVLNIVDKQPTVEAKEVVHSEWKFYHKENIVTCKNCSYEHYLGTYHQYAINFCPNCGADMRTSEE